jgi:hypothetical protein
MYFMFKNVLLRVRFLSELNKFKLISFKNKRSLNNHPYDIFYGLRNATLKFKESMSITHVIYRIFIQKKHENRNNVSPHRNHDIHYFFCNLVVHEMKKKTDVE